MPENKKKNEKKEESPVSHPPQPTQDAVSGGQRDKQAAGTQPEESFWDAVHEPFMARELNRPQVKAVIRKGLEQVWGSYKSLMTVFGLPESDYQKFMDFLRHHDLKPTLE